MTRLNRVTKTFGSGRPFAPPGYSFQNPLFRALVSIAERAPRETAKSLSDQTGLALEWALLALLEAEALVERVFDLRELVRNGEREELRILALGCLQQAGNLDALKGLLREVESECGAGRKLYWRDAPAPVVDALWEAIVGLLGRSGRHWFLGPCEWSCGIAFKATLNRDADLRLICIVRHADIDAPAEVIPVAVNPDTLEIISFDAVSTDGFRMSCEPSLIEGGVLFGMCGTIRNQSTKWYSARVRDGIVAIEEVRSQEEK